MNETKREENMLKPRAIAIRRFDRASTVQDVAVHIHSPIMSGRWFASGVQGVCVLNLALPYGCPGDQVPTYVRTEVGT